MPLCLPEQLCASGEYGGGGGTSPRDVVVARRVRAALQVAGGVARRWPASSATAVDVARLARMARAQQRDLRRRVAEALDAAARRRTASPGTASARCASSSGTRGSPAAMQQAAVAVDDRDRAAVDGCRRRRRA